MKKFYDTCSLLDLQEKAFEEPFYISLVTLQELENIKTSANKDAEIKYKARKITRLLAENEDLYDVIIDTEELNNNDMRIINSVRTLNEPVEFVTKDLSCKNLASAYKLNVNYIKEENLDNYTGFKEVIIEKEEELAYFYEHMNENIYNLYINQYLIIKTQDGGVIGPYIWSGTEHKEIGYPDFYSVHFGKIKPKDEYQFAAMDCLNRNQVSLLRGPAGSGKTFLSIAYMFHLLEKGKIDKIIIFCNTVATVGAAKLGFYPGTKNDKLLDSQIGNILSSKLGSRLVVEDMIESGKLLLLPFSDIRGFDTTGMQAAIYITEAQNLDITLLQLALQRVGDDCICIIDGDDTAQVDSIDYAGANNGIRRASEIYRGEDIYGEITLQENYRSRVGKIAEKM